jgi:hypothetical protein
VSDVSYIPPLPRTELRAALRRNHAALDPSFRMLAEDLLGAGSTIDLVASDPAGRVALILIGDEGGDRELLTRGIAQRAWVMPRLRDWMQLAPSLGLQLDAPVRLSLVCPAYAAETLAAAAALGRDVVELFVYRCVQNGASSSVLVERVGEADVARQPPAAATASQPPRFRSGLTEEDLNLTPLEVRDFR